MAVTYAQFIVEYEEFSDSGLQAKVTSMLAEWDAFLQGFGDTMHDKAVYTRTAKALANRLHGGTSTITTEDRDRYDREWDDILMISYRRAQISGGGLT